tara:strand:+ start:2002 stop:2697 length:696 start_codon:yes stop_codon:yes gene_type:complete
MSVSIVVTGADFSASGIDNAFYPFYSDLVTARFYGSSIPDFYQFKKNKNLGITGGASIVEQPLSSDISGNILPDITTDGQFTIVMVMDNKGAAGTHGFIGNNAVAGKSGNYAGDWSLSDYQAQKILQGFGLNATRANGTGTYIAILAVDDVANEVRLHMFQQGITSKESGAVTAQAPYTTRRIWVGADQFVGTEVNGISHLAHFNRALNETEMDEVQEWVRKFYLNEGLVI